MIQEGGFSRKLFVAFNYAFLFLMMLVTLYPVWLTFITSISNGLDVMKGGPSIPRWRRMKRFSAASCLCICAIPCFTRFWARSSTC